MKKQRGITLIALIITIIVMLILVGVTINIAMQGGLFDTARKAAEDTEINGDKEILQGAVVGSYNAEKGTIESQKLKDNLSNWDIQGEEIYTCISPNGNRFTLEENGNLHQKTITQDLAIIKEDESVGHIYIYPNAEKYYPELVDKAIVNFINIALGASVTNINEAKQTIIDSGDPDFKDKNISDISIDDLVKNFGYTSQNDFMENVGYIVLIDSEEGKREFLIEQNKFYAYLIISSFGQDKPEELARAEKLKNMNPNKYLEEYFIPENTALEGRTGESITANELASLFNDSTLNSTTIDEYWKTNILGSEDKEISLIAVQVIIKDFGTELITDNNILGSFGNMYFLKNGEENGNYKIKAYNDEYISIGNIEINE